MIDSREKVRVDKLQALQWRTLILIDDLLPAVEYSTYAHEMLFHSAQVIGKIKQQKLHHCLICGWSLL